MAKLIPILAFGLAIILFALPGEISVRIRDFLMFSGFGVLCCIILGMLIGLGVFYLYS